jgi:hypothetical protein
MLMEKNKTQLLLCVAQIIESPHLKKLYEDLKNMYESQNMKNEAKALEYLIQTKYADNLHTNSQ